MDSNRDDDCLCECGGVDDDDDGEEMVVVVVVVDDTMRWRGITR